MAKQKPEKLFRVGYVSGSIFPNDVETENGKRTIRSVNLQKRYSHGCPVLVTLFFTVALAVA